MEPTTHPQTMSANNDNKLPSLERGFVFHYASEYFDRGWSILPLSGKRPAIASWREYQSLRAGLNEIRKWFSDGETNVGIITGRASGLVVVDCDTLVDAEFWKERFPRTPLAVWTGGGGSHYYYRYPDAQDVSNRAGLLARRIDLRAEGGYVVAPPSRHTNGNLYRWQGTEEYCLEDVPYFSLEWISANAAAPKAAPTGTVQNPRSYIRSIRAISGEHGHNHTFRAACKLRDAGLTSEEALCELVIWNRTNASPPWSVRELLHKVQSAYRQRAKQQVNSREGSHD